MLLWPPPKWIMAQAALRAEVLAEETVEEAVEVGATAMEVTVESGGALATSGRVLRALSFWSRQFRLGVLVKPATQPRTGMIPL